MENLKTALLLLLLFAFTNMRCIKDAAVKKDVLPAETHEGKETFGCLLNGEVWLPSSLSYLPALTVSLSNNLFGISAIREGGESIEIEMKDFSGVGTYSTPSKANLTYRKRNIETKTKNFSITVTAFDDSKGIVSGNFIYEGVNEEGGIVTIKDGRFDVTYPR